MVPERGAPVEIPPSGTVRAWAPQARKLWKDVGKACGGKHPRAPAVKWLADERALEVVLSFLWDTRVGEMVAVRRLWEDEGGQDTDGEEGGPGLP